MTIWLKKRLGLLFSGTAAMVVLGASTASLRAQYEISKSPEEAAVRFAQAVEAANPSSVGYSEYATSYYYLFSDHDRDRLGYYGFGPLLTSLYNDSKKANFETSPPQQEGETIIVGVAPAPKATNLPVVIVKKGDGYVVDLLATYTKRRKLEGEGKLQSEVFRLTGVALPGLKGFSTEYVTQRSCQTHLRELQIGLIQYTQDYDEFYPASKNWSEVLYPYVRKSETFQCPAVPEGKSGYAFNTNLSQQPLSKLNNMASTISLYETSKLGPNVSGRGEDLAYRHKTYDGTEAIGHLVYADGHISFQGASQQKNAPKRQFNLNPPSPVLRKE